MSELRRLGPHYEVRSYPPFLGDKWRYVVQMNGHTEVEECPDHKTAQLRAAAWNYAKGQRFVSQIGLDGVP